MNNKPLDLGEPTVDVVYLTRDKYGISTGGETVLKKASDGREIARFGYDASGRETFRQSTSYKDGTEREIIVLTFCADGLLTQKCTSGFNENGDLVELTTTNLDDTIIDRQVYTYTADNVHFSRFNGVNESIDTWSKRIL